MTSVLYAAYGSNLHPVRIAKRVESAKIIGTSYLADRGFRFNKRSKDNSGKGNIILADEGVYVAIYTLSIRDKSALDQIEGLGYGYKEEVLDVPDFGACVTYVAESSAVDDQLLPYCWYKKLVLLGCSFHGFPRDYVAKISEFNETQDCDEKRRASNIEIIKHIEKGS